LEQTLKEKTAKGLFWGGISNFVQQIVGAVFGIAIARILSPGDYGLVGMLAIFTAIANTIMDSGFTVALVNKKEIRHEDYNAVFWFSLLIGVVIYVLLFFSAPLIAGFFQRPELTNLSRLLFLSLLIGSAGFAHNAILFKKLMIKERAKIDITAVSVSGIAGLILALSGFSYWGLALQAVLMAGISVFLRWRFAPWKPTPEFNFTPIREMFGFSSKLFVTNIIYQINNNILSVFIGKFYGKEQVGYYSQGNKWMGLGCNVTVGMIASVAQPVFVEANEDKDRQLQIFRKMIRFGAFVSFPALFGLAFIGREFILVTVGEKWLESIPFLQLFCVWGGLGYLINLYYQLLISSGKSNVVMFYNIFITLLSLAIVSFVAKYGVFHIVVAYVTVSVLSVAGWHYFSHKLIGLRFIHVLKDILPYLVITAGCFFVAWLLTYNIQNIYWLCILKVVIVATLYVLIMKYSRSAIFKECLEFFTSRMKRS
jgi:O-antigen/teichoic acid export membrane protein